MKNNYQRDKRTLQTYFHFSRMPFTKHMWARKMFDARSQMDLRDSLKLWLEVGGLSLVCGPTGVGKSISLRRFTEEIDTKRYEVFSVWSVRCSLPGFFRSLSRVLGLPVRQYLNDMFDETREHLRTLHERTGKDTVLIFDDVEVLSDEVLDAMRRVCGLDDDKDCVSVVLAGSDRLAGRLVSPANRPLCQRILYSHMLQGFTLEDAQGYVQFHLARAEGPKNLFTPDAVQLLFQLSKGLPRKINQIAVQGMIRAAVLREETIDAAFLKRHVLSNPLFERTFQGDEK